jgi:thiaminase/transcriptional activator TenA
MYTDTLWNDIAPLYEKTLELPFLRELASGELALEPFQFYLQQDAVYLEDFARALAITGARAASPSNLLRFVEFARGAIVTERALHESFFQRYGVGPAAERSPTCSHYTNFLLSVATTRSEAESMAALLPCFWIYREVGRTIYDQAADDNPYREWIDTYAGEEFAASVDDALAATEDAANSASPEEWKQMRRLFVLSSRLEYMFWESAYRQEQWMP